MLTNAEALQEFNEDVKPGISYKNALRVRKLLQEIKVEAQKLRVSVNNYRKQE